MNKLVIFVLSLILMATIIIEAVIFLRIFRFPFVQITFLGATHSLTHWIGWIGTLYIAFSTPLQPIVKRKAPKRLKAMLNIHMAGNMLAVLLVSIHFAHQVTRPLSSYPDLGTGVVLYAVMVLLVATGMAMYSGKVTRFSKQTRFLHPGFALTFYSVIIVHILQGVAII